MNADALRHVFALAAVMRGKSLPIVGEILGHTPAQTTARNAQLSDHPLLSASERIPTSLE